MTSVDEPPAAGGRARDAARTRAEILDVATREFARAGYDGARVDEIAARTRTTKRMIYYYFGGKEQLFTAVLERVYGELRDAGQRLDLGRLEPEAAVRHLAGLVFDHLERRPDVVRLVTIENIHEARHVTAARRSGRIGSPAPAALGRVLEAGQRAGRFRADVDAVDLHAMISSFCFFRVANRHTFDALYGRDLMAPARREHYRALLGDMVVAHLTARPADEGP
ncbi:TetR/AcrR family transcriptional regulator [Streptomyces bungoensis]|uniref:TetR/AcrR family transcriptional regulator n=1 Tax=Streptomyces bungoensis TaxID=285568 RepID=UPI003697C395